MSKETAYYENWLRALETLLHGNDMLSAASLENRAREQATHDNHDH